MFEYERDTHRGGRATLSKSISYAVVAFFFTAATASILSCEHYYDGDEAGSRAAADSTSSFGISIGVDTADWTHSYYTFDEDGNITPGKGGER